jgi:hypothetical protein
LRRAATAAGSSGSGMGAGGVIGGGAGASNIFIENALPSNTKFGK